MVIYSRCMKQLRIFSERILTPATSGPGALSKAMTLRRSHQAKKYTSQELCLTTPAEFLVYPVRGKVCGIVLGQFVTRKVSADELDQLAIRFHQAAIETSKGR